MSEKKTFMNYLLAQTIEGNFQEVYKSINANKCELEEKYALKFLVACCNACSNKMPSPDKLNERDLVVLVKLIFGYFKYLSVDECHTYLQSIFFIIKLLTEKKSIASILDLKELLMPEFLPSVFTPTETSIHQSISKTLYNTIVRIANAKDTTRTEAVLKLCYLVSALYKKSFNLTAFVESVHNCVISLVALNTDFESLLKYYCHFLELVDDTTDPNLYSLLINNFSYIYTELLKNQQFELAADCFKNTKRKLNEFKGKEYANLNKILEIIDWFNPPQQLNSIEIVNRTYSNLKSHVRQFETISNNLQAICDLISSVVFVILQYHYKSVDCEKWLTLSSDLHLELYAFLCDIAHIISRTPYKCHCKMCPTKTNLNEGSRMLNTIGRLGKLYITKQTEASRNYKIVIFKCLEKEIELIDKLKSNDCFKWKNHWSDLASNLYTIGMKALQNKDIEMCTLYLKRFVRGVLQFEGVNPEILDRNFLIAALSSISEAYAESKDYDKCLFHCALNIVLNSPKNEINRWIRTKAECRENTIWGINEIQELTWMSVLKKFENEMDFYDPNKQFRLNKQKRIEFLLLELRSYKTKWKSKLPMMATYRELLEIADSTLSAKVFIEIWGDCDLQVHPSLPKLLQITVKKLESQITTNDDLQYKFYMAFLYFLQHKYRVKDSIMKHCDEMEKTLLNSTKAPEEDNPVPPDPNDECDIVTSYDSLKLTVYLQMMKKLNKSLDIIFDFRNNFDKIKEREKLFRLLVEIGHEYNLHSNAIRALQAYHLALRIAQCDQIKLQQLQAISYVLEVCDVTKIENLVKEGDDIARLFSTENCYEEDVIVFNLCKSEAYFRVDVHKSYEMFRPLFKYVEEVEINELLKARIYLLLHEFNMLPCDLGFADHNNEISLIRIHQAQASVVRHYQDNQCESSYNMKIFFEIHEALAKMYHNFRLPREVRCYSKEIVVMAQQLLLPLRATTFLYYLAYADLRSCRFDDCKVKIEGVSDILSLSKSTRPITKDLEIKEKKFDEVVESLLVEFNDMMLDVPTKSPNTITGSPSLKVETFNVPNFLYHEDDCDCFCCTCLEYHQFVLHKTYLHASLYEHINKKGVAKDFFCGCITIYGYLKKKQNLYLKKMSKKVPVNLIKSPQKMFLEAYCTFLFEYVNFLLRSRKNEDSNRINKELIETLKAFQPQYVYLYNEALLQRLNILTIPREEFKIKNGGNVEEEERNGDVMKTPESKSSHVVITPERRNKHNLEIAKVRPKSLLFVVSDDEEEEKEVRVVKKTPAVIKNLPAFLSSTAKTPAPSTSKVKIYTNKSVKKKVLADIPPPKKESNVRMSDFLIPGSPDAYKTPNSKMDHPTSDHLFSRTKLLTEKLKNSSRKKAQVPPIVITDENSSSSNESRPVKTVRQNLLSQLEGDASERTGAIRRSARNRK